MRCSVSQSINRSQWKEMPSDFRLPRKFRLGVWLLLLKEAVTVGTRGHLGTRGSRSSPASTEQECLGCMRRELALADKTQKTRRTEAHLSCMNYIWEVIAAEARNARKVIFRLENCVRTDSSDGVHALYARVHARRLSFWMYTREERSHNIFNVLLSDLKRVAIEMVRTSHAFGIGIQLFVTHCVLRYLGS